MAKALKVSRFSKLSKDELVNELVEHPGISRALNPTWWSRYHNHVYGAAGVLGTLLAIIPFVLPRKQPMFEVVDVAKEVEKTALVEYSKQLFACAQELRKNSIYLRSLIYSVQDPDKHVPIGRVTTEATLSFLNNNFEKVTQFSYGEEDRIYELALKLRDASQRLKQLESVEDLIEWDKKYEMALGDLAFLNGFLSWYVNVVAEKDLTEKNFQALGRYATSSRFAYDEDIPFLRLRNFIDDNGEPILDYGDYLGLLD